MNRIPISSRPGIMVAVAVATILSACAATPEAPSGSLEVRSKLVALKANRNLAMQVPVAIEQAERAVALAETPESDAALAAHRIYLADHAVDTTRATAETRLAESQRPAISQQQDATRLAARTREANSARADAVTARNEAETARMAASAARNAADEARATTANEAELALARERELAEQIAMLQARTTERGIVLTLSDVLFATGSANLKAGSIDNLDRLVAFLDKYPERTAVIEGHTDNVGSEADNQDLSLRRSDAVRRYLADNGVASPRLRSVGKGESEPLATNETMAGRQQNRRVEIVIGSPMQSATSNLQPDAR